MSKPFLFAALAFGVCGASLALEPLKSSDEAHLEAYINRYLTRNDQNGDGKIEEAEDKRQWRHRKKMDADGDGLLDRDELQAMTFASLDSPGNKILDVLYKRTPTEDVFLDIYFPDKDAKNKPVVIYTHGGGWASGSRHGAANSSFGTVHKALLKEGFCVVPVGYRLVPKSKETAMRDCVIDAQDAIRFLSAYKDELGIDPKRIYSFGDSAGGHLAQMVLLAPPDAIPGDPDLGSYTYQTVAGVSWYGPCDFEDAQLFNHDDRENFRDRFGGRIMDKHAKPEDQLRLYREVSPVNYVTKESPALLMIQGDQDTTIPVKHVYRMEKMVEATGGPVEFLVVKNAGHNWRSVGADIDPSRDVIVQRTIDFLIKHKGK